MTAPGQIRHAFPAYKIFIFGIDITADTLAVTVNYNVGRAPNTCSITLANELDKYIYTTTDLKVVFKGDQDIVNATNRQFDLITSQGGFDPNFPEASQTAIIDSVDIAQQILENIRNISMEPKRTILERKLPIRASTNESVRDLSGNLSSLNSLHGDVFRYPLQAEDPIFHPNDPIRIFFRDPFNTRRWYHMFAGFVGDFDDNVDENNQRILTIGGEGPSKLLRYSRITTNPGIIDIKAIAQTEQDAVFRSFYSAGFFDLTLPEVLFAAVFGNNPDDPTNKFSIRRDSAQNTSTATHKFDGVGNFNFSRSAVVEFGPQVARGIQDSITFSNVPTVQFGDLGDYQSLIDHEVKESDLIEMLVENAPNNSIKLARDLLQNLPTSVDGSVDSLSIIKHIGTRPDIYPVDGGRLILLIPRSFGPSTNREILIKDLIDSPAMKTEMRSRLGMIYDIVNRIDFVFYESPKGDLICEFPLYDFDPDDWSLNESKGHKSVELGVETTEFASIIRGPFGRKYNINERDTYNFSKQITDEKIRTQMTSPWANIQNRKREAGTSIDTGQAPAVITLKHLVPLYGLRLEQVDPEGFIATKEAANVYAHIQLNKMNADSRNLGINAVPKFGLWLNRPLLFSPRNSIATTQSISHSIVWGMGGTVDTRVNVNYVRGWDGLLNPNDLDDSGNPKPVYTPIGGQPSRPLDYKLLFNLKNLNEGNNSSGVPPDLTELTNEDKFTV